jgi:hypothetical protein
VNDQFADLPTTSTYQITLGAVTAGADLKLAA